MNTFAAPLHRSWCVIERGIAALQPAGALAARLYIAQVFWLAGLTKIRDWETTLLLFTEEYRVPVLPPAWAAVSGTAGELLLPVLLVWSVALMLPAFVSWRNKGYAIVTEGYMDTSFMISNMIKVCVLALEADRYNCYSYELKNILTVKITENTRNDFLVYNTNTRISNLK